MGKNSEYVISGFCKNTFFAAMNLDGAKKLDINNIDQANYNLRNPEKGDEVAEAIKQKYGERLEAKCDAEIGGEIIDTALNGIRLSISIFAVLFAFITVSMVCKKAFIQEKIDIGIYKSVGFRSNDLRLQFALRFLIVAVLGSVLGVMISLLLSGRFILLILSSLEITEFPFGFTATMILIPVISICFCFFVFAYIISRKVKSVEIKDLVTE
jgi:ABC-type antimicrobial peptide transport system permease subunit